MLQATRIADGVDLNVEYFKFTGMFGIMDASWVEKNIPLRIAANHLHV
jgi:hypothetical protein